jgi:beta-glucosidase
MPHIAVPRRRLLQLALLSGLAATLFAASPLRLPAATSTPIYLDSSYTFPERASDLVARMTPQQRANELTSSQAPAFTPSGGTAVSAYGWWNEALHGVSRESTAASGNAVTLQNTTSYPIDQSLGASWDPDLVYRIATEISNEAREVVRSNKLDLDFYSPTMNLQHDPRWGRNDEAYGEDPYLVTKVVSQFVNGMEGKDQSGNLLPDGSGFYKTLTTIKHYAANNSEVNRRSGSADMDDRTLREFYTMAFRGITEATHEGSIMSSYNRVNGVPTAASSYLIDTLARQTFGFNGYFTGDCDAIAAGIVPQHHWQPVGFPHPLTGIEALSFALSAGEDAECNAGFTGANTYKSNLLNAIGMWIPTPNGVTNVNDLDVSATRLFTARMELGEFDPDANVPWLTQARARVPQGTWTNANTNLAVTETPARLALAREAADKSLVLLKNSTTTRKDASTGKLLPIVVPPTGAFKVLVIGALANNANFYLGGYSSTQGTNGQAKEVTPYNGIKAAVLAINPGAQVDFARGFTGTSNAAAQLTTVDTTAVNTAPNYDEVIVYAGTDSGTATEDVDRTAITLPAAQGSLISQVAAKNPNTIAVLETIGPVDVTSWASSVASIVWSSYNGQRKGEALADVLLGAYNPSGRTNGIWYQNVGQIPAITTYSIRPVGATGRTYMYYNGGLAYPFGYGLSYSSFAFSNLQLDSHALDANDTLHVSADVTNTSGAAGNEVVELYVNTPDADPSLQRPIKRLEGFKKIFLDAGETRPVQFALAVPDVAFFDQAAGKWSVDNGRYGVQISTSSADSDIQLQDFVNVTGAIKPLPNVVSVKPAMPGDAGRGIAQRVMFPEGAIVQPGLTVSMNDDTLYGFIEPGSSKPFPVGFTFAYSSNRPSVASVDADGTIRTLANGAATITATATYQGVSKSTTFPIRVLSYASTLYVNGRAIAGFIPDVLNYDVVVPLGVAATPQVTADVPGDASSAVTQATGIAGTANVVVTGPDGLSQTYRITFARQASDDEFSGAIGSQWSFVRDTPAEYSLTSNPGSLTISSRVGDLNTTTNTAHNLLLQPAPKDFTTTTKLTFSAKPNAATQQGGVIAYQDDDNYLKFDLEATSATNIQFNTTLEDSSTGVAVAQTLNATAANTILPANNTIWLRLAKNGNFYSTSYSVDGTTFVPVWTTGATFRNLRTGVFAYNRASTSTTLQVAFDFVHVVGTAPIATPPPVTTLSTTPATVNGWVRQDPTVTLTAADNSSWGIASTTYSLDEAPPQAYTGPFQVNGDGIHTLDFGSTDNAGTIEATNSVEIRIDSIKPTVAVTPDRAPDHNGWYNHAVTFTATGNDGDGSGIAACDAPVVYNGPDSGAAGPFSFTCTDVAGNADSSSSGTFAYDATAPDVSVPADVTAEATGPSGAVVTYPDATATDALSGPLAANCLPASGSTFPLGHTEVACSATDLAGNTGTGSFDVFVPDTSAPEVHAPANVVAEATGPGGAAVTYPDATAFDLVDGPVLASCEPASGSTFPLGHTTVTCSAFDTVGNRGSSFFDVQVVDTTPPAVHPHADIVANATEPGGAHVSFSLTADDIVDGSLPVTCVPASGSLFAIGHTTVLCHATDTRGNTGSTSFDVSVKSALVQLRDLNALIDAFALQQGKDEKFVNTLNNVVKHLAAGKTKQVCKELDDLIKKAGKESGKSLTPAESDAIVAAATRIQSVAGC